MFENYDLIKFVFSFLFIIALIYGFYFIFMRYGQKLSIAPKGEIKIKDIKFFSRDKGFVLVEIKDKQIFFSFDNQNGLKLIKTWEKEKIDEKT